MVEVDFRALRGRQAAEVFVVRVMLQKGDTVGADSVENFLGDGSFSRAGTARDANDEGRMS